jgi:hypothetical protein
VPDKITIDFYRVQVPNRAPAFDAILADVAKAEVGNRNADIAGSPVRLQSESFGADVIEGEIIRIQMDDLPPKAGLDGSVGPLGVTDDEGIGHETKASGTKPRSSTTSHFACW